MNGMMKVIVAVLLTSVMLLSGCQLFPESLPPPAESSRDPVLVPTQVDSSPTVTFFPAAGASVTLLDMIDCALENNPETRISWLRAKSSWAQAKSRESLYYPTFDMTGNATRSQQTYLGNQLTVQQASLTTGASLTWLLLDFGKRAADNAGARDAYYAAAWSHNSRLQKMVLQVQSAWYQTLSLGALVRAAEATVRERSDHLKIVEEKHRAGLSTIADLVQTKTSLSQAKLSLETVRGQEKISRGMLNNVAGIPVSRDLVLSDMSGMPDMPDMPDMVSEVDSLIEKAVQSRPDLFAARASVSAAEEEIARQRGDGLPSLAVTSSGNLTWYEGEGSQPSENYSIALMFKWPLFTGFANRHLVEKARIDAESARTSLLNLANQAALDVWTGYNSLKTASAKIAAAESLLENATLSQQVALERYRAGIGTLLELVTADEAVAGARAQSVIARGEWFIATAALAYATGTLEIPESRPDRANETTLKETEYDDTDSTQ